MGDSLKRLERRGHDQGKAIVADMLQTKYQRDGRTLLMYAARWGKQEQFRDLFDEMSRRVSLSPKRKQSRSLSSPMAEIIYLSLSRINQTKSRLRC